MELTKEILSEFYKKLNSKKIPWGLAIFRSNLLRNEGKNLNRESKAIQSVVQLWPELVLSSYKVDNVAAKLILNYLIRNYYTNENQASVAFQIQFFYLRLKEIISNHTKFDNLANLNIILAFTSIKLFSIWHYFPLLNEKRIMDIYQHLLKEGINKTNPYSKDDYYNLLTYTINSFHNTMFQVDKIFLGERKFS
jgi:hypothetical protein